MTVEFLDNAARLAPDQSSPVIPFPKQCLPHKTLPRTQVLAGIMREMEATMPDFLSRLRTATDRDHRRDDQPGDGRWRAGAVAAPRVSADACDVAQGGAPLGAGFYRCRARPARLWRQLKATGRREFCQLFETRVGAGSGRGDGGARPRPLRGRRTRPRRAGDAPAAPRPPRENYARRDARHRPDSLPL